MTFPERQLEKIVKEICQELSLIYTPYADGWIIGITKNNVTKYIYGYNFCLNNSCASRVADDKAATYEILNQHQIKAFAHYCWFTGYVDFQKVFSLYQEFNKDVVVKPNSGSGGRSVFHIRDNENELVDKVSLVVNKNSYVALSPFYQYDTEYRIIMHKNQLLTVYAKERQFVIGDGETNLFSLIVNKYGSLKTELANFVPAKDEKVVINWKHNLGLGAVPNLEVEKEISQKMVNLSQQIMKVLDIELCSIDFALIDKEFYVVEVNAGIMMEKYSKVSEDTYRKTYEVYKSFILEMFK
ncbi:MAG: hypothetical protein LBC44_01890 [Mycoplasmataceae bacterium]|nr:hypothetical protein [Mycoplasmataceae bacterium]